ncbi:hypothetical protein C8R44DRAFT_868788 [Mycena epipterygia]|nr:hypothetical protein C8R44DRAFT_868788 [Mycena epipterygia]
MGASLSTSSTPSWQETCANNFNCTSPGLLNMTAQPIVPPASCLANLTLSLTNLTLSTAVWGITAEACRTNCGNLTQSVEFSSSVVSITTWLLPWVALIAQLPFEASGWMDLLSGFLCVGSPVLAAYSLALTAFNRHYIFHNFRQLRNRAEQETYNKYRYMVERVDAAMFILQEAQQCPMHANQRNGEIASLIVLNDERIDNFWKTAAKDLENTSRGFTYSFLAQVLLAFLTYVLSFITAVHDSLGSTYVGLQFASSTVWSWMFPIVFGYIRVGTQYKAGCIKAALTDNRIMPDRDATGEVQYVYQKGLCPNADVYAPLTPLDPPPPTTPGANPLVPRAVRLVPRRPSMISDHNDHSTQSPLDSPVPPTSMTSDHDDNSTQLLLDPPTWWGFDVRGDERREGPIFTYARIFTSFACAEHVWRGFEASIEKFHAHASIPRETEEAARSCGFHSREDLVAFTAWSQIPTPAIHHMFGAAIVALFLQWGTTGAAIFVAYKTPTFGLGCRSGSYLIYGIAATLSWAMLVFSHLVSHAFMQRLENNPIDHAGALWAHSPAWRVLEDIGTFQTCWCETVAFQFHRHGWTPVFKMAKDLSGLAEGIWIGGFIFSLAVSVLVSGFFAYHRH